VDQSIKLFFFLFKLSGFFILPFDVFGFLEFRLRLLDDVLCFLRF
jgi:hypothetical protein